MSYVGARSSRLTRLARKDTSAVTNELLIAAPGVSKRIVIDSLYFNINISGSIELFFNTTGWTDADGVIGGNFGAQGGFINEKHLEGGENQPLSWTTTGAGDAYLTIVYHIEV